MSMAVAISYFATEYHLSNLCFHVSGYASRDDLILVVQTIHPKSLIPVHTEHPEIYAEVVGDITNVRILEKGVPMRL
ncbi:MAG: hypothetical protein HYX78_04325 [Armatimonadetes bacterium]|nr:hypothetical protein [Armatimonadota bacterium]